MHVCRTAPPTRRTSHLQVHRAVCFHPAETFQRNSRMREASSVTFHNAFVAGLLEKPSPTQEIKLGESIFTGTNCRSGLNKYDNTLCLCKYTFIIHTFHSEEASSLIWANYCRNTLLAQLAETCFGGEKQGLKKQLERE